MQVLSVIVPYTKSTSNLFLTCRIFKDWLSNNGFPIKTSEGELTPENLSFYRLLNYPKIEVWMNREVLGVIRSDNINHLKLLLDHKADFEAQDAWGTTPLMRAAEDGSIDCLKLLLEYKANIETRGSNKWTALQTAVWNCNSDCLRLLLDHGADTEAKTKTGSTVLIVAAEYKKIDCLRVLLSYGAKVDPWVRKEFPQFAELWGESFSSMQVLAVIVPYIKSTSNLALSCCTLRFWLSNNAFPIKTSKGELCLETYGFYKSVGCPDIGGWERREVFRAIDEGNLEMLQLLLDNGVNIEARDNNEKSTALMRAVSAGKIGCLKLLLERGADLEATDMLGSTALINAARYNETDCLKLLLERGADPKAKTNEGTTALIFAAMSGEPDCLSLLLEYKADIEVKNIYKYTALKYAATYSRTDCIKILLENGAKVDPEIRANYPQYSELWGGFYSLNRFTNKLNLWF